MRTQVGSLNGIKYVLIHDRLCNQMAVDSKAWAWFLFIGDSARPGNYSGNYETKAQALGTLNKQQGRARCVIA